MFYFLVFPSSVSKNKFYSFKVAGLTDYATDSSGFAVACGEFREFVNKKEEETEDALIFQDLIEDLKNRLYAVLKEKEIVVVGTVFNFNRDRTVNVYRHLTTKECRYLSKHVMFCEAKDVIPNAVLCEAAVEVFNTVFACEQNSKLADYIFSNTDTDFIKEKYEQEDIDAYKENVAHAKACLKKFDEDQDCVIIWLTSTGK